MHLINKFWLFQKVRRKWWKCLHFDLFDECCVRDAKLYLRDHSIKCNPKSWVYVFLNQTKPTIMYLFLPKPNKHQFGNLYITITTKSKENYIIKQKREITAIKTLFIWKKKNYWMVKAWLYDKNKNYLKRNNDEEES